MIIDIFSYIAAASILLLGGYLLDNSFRRQQRELFQIGGVLMFAGVSCVIYLLLYREITLILAFLLLSAPTSFGYILSGIIFRKK